MRDGALSRLLSIGFHEAGVRDRLGLKDLNDLAAKALPIYRRERLGERDPLASAIDLFVLQQALPASELDALLDPPDQQALVRDGMLERQGGSVHALASLYPVGRDLIFSDHAWPQLGNGAHSDVHHDRVMYVGTDSRWLARVTGRRPVAAALDLCCGSGIHALLAASHSGSAAAVDINPRAVRYATYNAKAMGLPNLQALQGDLYTPIGNSVFDLVTANPPFVPAPAQEMGFRDGGPTGEDVLRRIVEGLPLHLARGGTAQIVTELGERDGEPLETRLRQWLGGASMDIVILRLRVHSAQTYAIGHARGDDPVAILDSVDRWARNLVDQGYGRVVSVLLAFQWSEAPWSREDEAQPPGRDAGSELEYIFSAERLSRDPALEGRLRMGKIARTGPVALVETRGLGVDVPPTIEARRVGLAMSVEHLLDPLERDILTSLDQPVATSDLLSAAARASVSEEAVLKSMVSLVRKRIIRPES